MLPHFVNPSLLETALTHRSAINEKISHAHESNERLEFLGDAVLELITTEFLFGEYPSENEGVLTAYRSALVKTETLSAVAVQLGLGEKLYLSRGEERTGGRTNPSLLADTFEAVVGALYLDQGYEVTRGFLKQTLFGLFDEILANQAYRDAKSLLQEKVQALGLATPHYTVVSEKGPDHDKIFTIEVRIGGQLKGSGTGKSKQAAQQAAASQALAEYAS